MAIWSALKVSCNKLKNQESIKFFPDMQILRSNDLKLEKLPLGLAGFCPSTMCIHTYIYIHNYTHIMYAHF